MKSFIKNIISNLASGSLLASGGLTFIFRIGGLGLSFLVTLLITRLYGDAVYGSYSLAFTLSQAVGLIFALGFPNALISLLGGNDSGNPYSQHILRRAFGILGLCSLLPFAVLYFGAAPIAINVFNTPELETYLKIAAFTVPAMVLHELLLYFFIATGNVIRFNIFMFIVPNILLIVLLLVFRYIPGSYTFLFYFLSILLTLGIEVFFAFNLKAQKQNPSVPVKQMLVFTLPMMFSGLMLYLLNWTDVFMLGAMVPEEAVGHYNLAYKIASLATLIIISMNVVLAPRIAALYKENDFKTLHKTVSKTTRYIIILTIPVALVLIVFSGYLLNFFGEGFIAGRQALIIITCGFFLNACAGNVDQILNMTGNQRILLYITIGGFICNVVLNYILIPLYGINGAAWASLLTNVGVNLTCILYIKKRLGFYTFA